MMNDMLYSETCIARRNAAAHHGNDAVARPVPGNTGIGRIRGSETGTGGDSLS